ncbi:MAG: rpoE 4 [Fibrobacteres bacterium]|nr:rpoE 4 [Fibrobacterota bacterium]
MTETVLTRAEETSLIARVIGGESGAFGPLVDRYQKPVLNFIYNIVRNPDRVEDLGQETFIKAFRALGTHDPARAAFSTWLFTIARNTCFDELRRPKIIKAGLEVLDETLDRSYGPHDPQGLFVLLERVLSGLPEDQREAFDVVCTQGMSLEEASVILMCPVGTVKSRVNRAREVLRRKVLGHTPTQGGHHAKP